MEASRETRRDAGGVRSCRTGQRPRPPPRRAGRWMGAIGHGDRGRGEAENRRRKKRAEGTSGPRRGKRTARFLPGRRTAARSSSDRAPALVSRRGGRREWLLSCARPTPAARRGAAGAKGHAWVSRATTAGNERVRDGRPFEEQPTGRRAGTHSAIWLAQERREEKKAGRQCGRCGRAARKREGGRSERSQRGEFDVLEQLKRNEHRIPTTVTTTFPFQKGWSSTSQHRHEGCSLQSKQSGPPPPRHSVMHGPAPPAPLFAPSAQQHRVPSSCHSEELGRSLVAVSLSIQPLARGSLG